MESTLEISRRLNMRGFIVIFSAVITIFLVLPLFERNFVSHLFLQGCLAVLLLATTYTLRHEKMILAIAFTFACPFLLLDSLSIYYDSVRLMAISYGFYCSFLLFATVLLSKNVFTQNVINTNLMFGVVTIYILAGIFWAKLYFVGAAFFPGSFHGVKALDFNHSTLLEGYNAQFDLLYYSFCTMTTLGLGDIAPTHNFSKSLTILQAIFGQLFVATVIGKTVSLWIPDKSNRKTSY